MTEQVSAQISGISLDACLEVCACNRPVDDMISFLSRRGELPTEGSSSQEQQDYLRLLARQLHARLIGEIGFNAGISSLAFLSGNSRLKVISFDIGYHQVVRHAKEFIDKHYPGRHELVIGDSKLTVPRYAREHPETSFDLVFIDGGHDHMTASADIANLRLLCNPGTGIVIDDLTPWLDWGAGPTVAWNEAVRQGLIVPVEMFKDGQRVHSIEPPGRKAWAFGLYR